MAYRRLRRFPSILIPACLSFNPSKASRQQLQGSTMRLLAFLEDGRKSGAIWYESFRQSPWRSAGSRDAAIRDDMWNKRRGATAQAGQRISGYSAGRLLARWMNGGGGAGRVAAGGRSCRPKESDQPRLSEALTLLSEVPACARAPAGLLRRSTGRPQRCSATVSGYQARSGDPAGSGSQPNSRCRANT